MNMNILFDYPSWMIILCILCGLLYSGLLYYRSKTEFHPLLRRVLAVFRFIVVTVLAFLLLAPLVERRTQHVEQPLLIFVQDNSSSLLLAEDSAFYHDQYLPAMNDFMNEMSERFQTRLYTFGESVVQDGPVDFTDRVTNMSEVFGEMEVRYSNRNIGAVVMAGDGIFNRGVNPLYAAANVNYPLYTLALGDTLPRRDLILKGVNHNQITYLGNRFPLEIEIEAMESRGMTSRLTVSRNGEELFGENITFGSDHHIEIVSLHLEADEPGMQQYRAELSPLADEVSLENNYRDFFIDVIDGRQKVLILANSPHPDVGALKAAITNNDHFEAEVSLMADFSGSIEAYDLVIMHQLPSDQHPRPAVLEQADQTSTAFLFVIGKQTNLPAFNRIATGLEIEPRTGELTETLPLFNQAFVLFSLPEMSTTLLDLLPPLYSPFGNYNVSGAGHILLYQKIGAVPTDQPLIMFADIGGRRSGVITGEGLWRWRLHSFMRRSDHRPVDELISRIIQYLAIQEDRRLFRVNTEHIVYENEAVIFEAELYNRGFELINDPEVQLFVRDMDGVEYPYIMGRTANAYRLNAGNFRPGEYTWQARVSVGEEIFTDEGVFNVAELDLEGLRTIADHSLLFQMAAGTNAAMFYPGQWEALAAHINERTDIRPRLYDQKEFSEIINLKALFFIVLLFLSVEWFVRKRSGSY